MTYLMRFSPLESKLRGSLSNGNWVEAFSHFIGMRRSGAEVADPSLFPSLMKASSSISFSHGACFHACSIKQGFQHFTSVGNSTIDLYVKWGFMDAAVSVFQGITRRDSVSWNTVVHGFLDRGDHDHGLRCFMQGRAAGFEPNVATLVLLVQAFRSLSFFCQGQQLHGYMIKSGLWGVGSVQNVVLGLYCDVDLVGARQVFDEMPQRDVISWSIMIGGFVQGGEPMLALEVLTDMVSEECVEPDGLTLVSALKACSTLGHIDMGTSLHGFVICRGLDNDVFVDNCLIDMYSKCGDTHSACRVFNDMPLKNNVSWNSILCGLVHSDMHSEAVEMFKCMRMGGVEEDEVTLTCLLQSCKDRLEAQQCKVIHSRVLKRGFESNQLLVNSLMDAYAKCKLIRVCERVFNGLKTKNQVSWGTMIAGYGECGMPEDAMGVYNEMMESGELPNEVVTLNLVEASGSTAELGRVKWAHGIATRRGVSLEVGIGTAILEMYSKCGCIEHARRAFDQILEKNVMSWSAMIGAYGMNGRGRESLALFSEMKRDGVKPNGVTALSVLSGCSHGGLVAQGVSFFREMVEVEGITPDGRHYACLVDLLSRAGRVEDALEVIGGMMPEEEAGGSLWGALLSGCRRVGNTHIGGGVAAQLLEVEPRSSGGYLLATGMHALGGEWGEVGRLRRLLRERGLKPQPAYSMLIVEGKANNTYKFVAGDRFIALPHAAHCCAMLQALHSSISSIPIHQLLDLHFVA